jgi:hypothetical protein
MIPAFQHGQLGLSMVAGTSPSDPYYGNTKLLVLATEANGSTTPADSSPSARTITSVGGATVTNISPKFLGNIETSFGAKYFSVAHSTDFNIATGAYTVDMWLFLRQMPDTTNPFFTLFSKGSDASNGPWCFIYYNGGAQYIYYRNNATELVTPVAHGMTVSTWYHIEVSSNGTTHRIRKNGTTLTTGTNSVVDTTKTLLIGSFQNSGGTALHLASARFEDFRWTAGVQRNSSDFTPLTTKAPAY